MPFSGATGYIFRTSTRFLFVWIFFIGVLLLSTYTNRFYPIQSFSQTREQITLTAMLIEPRDRWDILIPDALDVLRQKHPDIDIDINYTVYQYIPGRLIIARR